MKPNNLEMDIIKAEKVINKSKALFSNEGYCFCHFIENYSAQGSLSFFLKEATLEELMETEKYFIEKSNDLFYRKHFINDFGIALQVLNKKDKEEVCKHLINAFYDDLKKIKKPMIIKQIERLGL